MSAAAELDGWTVPTAWREYLLKGWKCRRDPSSTLKGTYWQLHNMGRDTQGRFNRLEGGKPAMSPRFLRDLDQAVADQRDVDEARLLPTWEDVTAAMEAAREVCPREVEVLEYFQVPPWMRKRSLVAFCLDMQIDDSTAYRMRDRAVLAVWLQLRAEVARAWSPPSFLASAPIDVAVRPHAPAEVSG